jgi:hypothetical protein
VRRVVMNESFEKIYDGKGLAITVTGSHVLGPVIPRKRMTFEHEIVLTDRNNDERICIADAFNTGRNTLIFIGDVGFHRRSGVIVPSSCAICHCHIAFRDVRVPEFAFQRLSSQLL